jgi:hypothetical protein
MLSKARKLKKTEKNPSKLWRFGDACHVSVTLQNSKAFSSPFSEYEDFGTRTSSVDAPGVDAPGDIQIYRSTDRRTIFSLLHRETSRKVIKSGGKNFFISAWFLRHSDASRSYFNFNNIISMLVYMFRVNCEEVWSTSSKEYALNSFVHFSILYLVNKFSLGWAKKI